LSGRSPHARPGATRKRGSQTPGTPPNGPAWNPPRTRPTTARRNGSGGHPKQGPAGKALKGLDSAFPPAPLHKGAPEGAGSVVLHVAGRHRGGCQGSSGEVGFSGVPWRAYRGRGTGRGAARTERPDPLQAGPGRIEVRVGRGPDRAPSRPLPLERGRPPEMGASGGRATLASFSSGAGGMVPAPADRRRGFDERSWQDRGQHRRDRDLTGAHEGPCSSPRPPREAVGQESRARHHPLHLPDLRRAAPEGGAPRLGLDARRPPGAGSQRRG
jgi:hypothetical protein